MNSPDTEVDAIPLVETGPGSPAHDLFSAARDPQTDEMYQTIWKDFHAELIPRLQSLGTINNSVHLKEELHAVRGMSAQFGLFLLELYLCAWEVRSIDPQVEKERYLPGALVIARRSLTAIEEAFPYLKGDYSRASTV